MRIVSFYLGAILGILIFTFIYAVRFNKTSFIAPEEQVKAGQVWVYFFDNENPFAENISATSFVLEVREGWVKISNSIAFKPEYAGLRDWYIDYDRISTYKSVRKLVYDPKP